jgi:hypothetical protein
MSTYLAGASVMRKRILETREASCVPRETKSFFIPVVHNPLGAVGHVTPPEPTLAGRRGSELQGMWQRVHARLSPRLDLKLVCRGTRSAGY